MYFEDAGSDCLPFKLLKDSVRALVSSVAHERRGLRFIQTLGGVLVCLLFFSHFQVLSFRTFCQLVLNILLILLRQRNGIKVVWMFQFVFNGVLH